MIFDTITGNLTEHGAIRDCVENIKNEIATLSGLRIHEAYDDIYNDGETRHGVLTVTTKSGVTLTAPNHINIIHQVVKDAFEGTSIGSNKTFVTKCVHAIIGHASADLFMRVQDHLLWHDEDTEPWGVIQAMYPEVFKKEDGLLSTCVLNPQNTSTPDREPELITFVLNENRDIETRLEKVTATDPNV